MAKCSLRFYEKSKLSPEKNWCFDNIETYLGTLTAFDVSDFQYQRFELDKEIRVDFTQNEQTISTSAKRYDYLRISTTINNTAIYYYYFIIKTRQVSESTIAYQLRMDTINTFKYSASIGNDKYTLSAKTLVKREHKDRVDVSNILLLSEDNVYPDEPEIYNTEPINGKSFLFDFDSIYDTIPLGSNMFTFTPWTFSISIYYANNTLKESYPCQDYVEIYKIGGNNYSVRSTNSSTGTTVQMDITRKYKMVLTLISHYNVGSAYANWQSMLNMFRPRTNPQFVYKRIIDYYQEGLSTQLFKTNEEALFDSDKDNQWYVMYASSSAVDSEVDYEPKYINPVQIRFYSDKGYTLTSSGSTEVVLYASSAIIPKYKNSEEYMEYVQPNASTLGDVYVKIGGVTYDFHDYKYLYFSRKNNSDLVFNAVQLIKRDNTFVNLSNIESIIFYGINEVEVWGQWLNHRKGDEQIAINSGETSYSGTCPEWNNVDITDSRLIKCFAFPYAPLEFLVGKDDFTDLPDGLIFSTDNVIEVNNRTLNFKYQKRFSTNVLKNVYIEKSNYTSFTSKPRNIIYESKMLHSDYYQPKFVYDSFSFGFTLENIDIDEYYTNFQDASKLYTTYVVSNNVQSKFMFMFDSYVLKRSFQDYDNVLCIERNNEKALFNNAYINYIRSGGYSYDTKKASSQNAVNGVTTALSIVGAIGSFASVGYTGAKGVVAGIALTTTAVTSIMRSVHNAQEQDRAISQKLLQSQMQGTSVQGSEDIDILTAFSGNKAKIVEYTLSEKMTQAMWDLFHYCGYATHEQKKPVINTRLYFNFVQAEIVFEEFNFNDEIAQDIRNKWNDGITFFHAVSGVYDIDQQYENFETSLI